MAARAKAAEPATFVAFALERKSRRIPGAELGETITRFHDAHNFHRRLPQRAGWIPALGSEGIVSRMNDASSSAPDALPSLRLVK